MLISFQVSTIRCIEPTYFEDLLTCFTVRMVWGWKKSKAEDPVGIWGHWHLTAVFLRSAKGQLEQIPLAFK